MVVSPDEMCVAQPSLHGMLLLLLLLLLLL
jgi:hypothetical protein